jgi:hypothetical protein
LVLFNYPANPVSSSKNRVDPAEVNKSNSPQSDESIIRSSAVLTDPRTEEVSLDASSGKRKERGEKMTVSTLRKTAPKKKTTPALNQAQKPGKLSTTILLKRKC